MDKSEPKKELTYKGVPLTDEQKAIIKEQLDFMQKNPEYKKQVAESIAEKKQLNKEIIMENETIAKNYIANVSKQVEEIKSEINSFFLKNGKDNNVMYAYRLEFKDRILNLKKNTWMDFPTELLNS